MCPGGNEVDMFKEREMIGEAGAQQPRREEGGVKHQVGQGWGQGMPGGGL